MTVRKCVTFPVSLSVYLDYYTEVKFKRDRRLFMDFLYEKYKPVFSALLKDIDEKRFPWYPGVKYRWGKEFTWRKMTYNDDVYRWILSLVEDGFFLNPAEATRALVLIFVFDDIRGVEL